MSKLLTWQHVTLLCILATSIYSKQREQQLGKHYWIVADHVEYWEPQQQKRSTNVEFKKSKLNNSDPITFVEIENRYSDIAYGADHNNIYRESQKVNVTNPCLFTLLGQEYSTDKKHIFYEGKVLRNADPATFQTFVTSSGIDAKDAHNFYYKGKKRKLSGNVDEKTFTYIGCNHFQTGTTILLFTENEKEITFSPLHLESFTVLNEYYSKDNAQVYYLGQPLSSADPKTFTAFGTTEAKDASGFWSDKGQRAEIEKVSVAE